MNEQLLALDREAILGRLSAGLVHAINNVLSGIIGQVDLMLLTGPAGQSPVEIEAIATTCDEGVKLTKALAKVIMAMKESGPVDPTQIVESCHILLARIFRRAGVERESSAASMLPAATNGDLFAQAAFHIVTMCYESLAVDGAPSRKLSSRLRLDGEMLRLDLESTSTLVFPQNSVAVDAHGNAISGEDWHRLALDTVTSRCGGEWSYSEDGRKASLKWKASSGGSTMIY